MLEDLAARDSSNSEAFQHVVEEKGIEEVKKRRKFLEIEWYRFEILKNCLNSDFITKQLLYKILVK